MSFRTEEVTQARTLDGIIKPGPLSPPSLSVSLPHSPGSMGSNTVASSLIYLEETQQFMSVSELKIEIWFQIQGLPTWLMSSAKLSQ